MNKITRTLTPQIKVLDEAACIAEYIASDETLDHSREIIAAAGWRFTHFAKNSPFVDSHDYSSISSLLGSVLDYRVEGGRLIETVQWAPGDNPIAKIGWAMTVSGHLKAVSVGFLPVRMACKWDNNGADLVQAVTSLGIDPATAARVQCIYLEQEQLELSACILGCNPSAVARSYKAGVLSDSDIDLLAISATQSHTNTARAAQDEAAAARKQEQLHAGYMRNLEKAMKAVSSN